MKAILTAIVLLIAITTVSDALASAEEVFLYKVLGSGNEGIIIRANGDAYQIEKGAGCFGFSLREGRKILIVSPGVFLGAGSKILIPDRDQECRIWNSTPLGNFAPAESPATPAPGSPTTPRNPPIQIGPVIVAAAQVALTLLGYNPGPVDGTVGEQTDSALRAFQDAKGLSKSGNLNNPTRAALSTDLSKRFPNDNEIQKVVGALLGEFPAAKPGRSATRTSGCEEGHWIQSVSSGGAVLVLEDGSVWKVDAIDRIDTILWLPTDGVIICAESMINTNDNKKVSVTRVK